MKAGKLCVIKHKTFGIHKALLNELKDKSVTGRNYL